MEEGSLKNIHVRPRACLSINITILRLLGIWFPEEEVKTWRTRLYYPYAILAQGVVFWFMMFSEFINLIQVFGNIEKMTDASFLFLTHFAQMGKITCFVRFSVKIVELLAELESEMFTPKNEKQYKILDWSMSRAKSDSVILLSMGTATCVLWAIFPFIENTGELQLPLAGWYPVDIKEGSNFVYVFIYQVACCWFNALSNISMDTAATGVFVQIYGQIDMLKESLENMKRDAILSLRLKKKRQGTLDPHVSNVFNNFNNSDVENDMEQDDKSLYTHEELEKEIIEVYKNCVKHHDEIIRFAEDIEEIFNMCFLAQFAGSVVIICLTLFKISLVETILSLEFISLVLYQGCIVFELLLYCWHGNEMILKSTSLADSVYHSAWYEFSPKFSKDLLLTMVRAIKPIRVTSGKFFFLSIMTFTAILRSSWSYFAVLNSMHED